MDFYAIGDEHMILGFGLVGIAGKVVSSSDEMLDALKDAMNTDTRVVLINEKFTQPVHDEIENMIVKMDFPLVIELPDRTGPAENRKSLKELLKSSIGFNV